MDLDGCKWVNGWMDEWMDGWMVCGQQVILS
jgi:hypothetical protein